MRFPAGVHVDGLALGFGAVWVVSSSTATLYRIGPTVLAVTGHVDVGTKAGRPGAWLGHVWVAVSDSGGDTVVVDPQTLVAVSAQLLSAEAQLLHRRGPRLDLGHRRRSGKGDSLELRVHPRQGDPGHGPPVLRRQLSDVDLHGRGRGMGDARAGARLRLQAVTDRLSGASARLDRRLEGYLSQR